MRRLQALGFDMVDLRPDCWNGIDQDDLQRLGIVVPCTGVTPMQMAPGLSLDSLATPSADAALPYFTNALERSASIGATCAYMTTPDRGAGEEPAYVRSMSKLGDRAASLGMKLCVEPSPGRALADYTETMRLIDNAGSEGLFALLDLGHLLLTGEDPPATIKALGDRLGYVHVDDNDGQSDAHYGLMEGVMSEKYLYGFLDALADSPYKGPLAIEIKSDLPSPLLSLVRSRNLIAEWALAAG